MLTVKKEFQFESRVKSEGESAEMSESSIKKYHKALEADDKIDAGGWRIKTEEVEVSDLEFENEPDEFESNLPDVPSTSRLEPEPLETVKTERDDALECSSCRCGFADKTSLTRHITQVCFRPATRPSHAPASKTPCWTKMFECRLCQKKFDVASALKRHEQNHPKPDSHSHRCKVCGATFTRRCHRDRHLLSHAGRRDFVCAACGQRFTRKNNRDKHRATAHASAPAAGADGRPFACPVCHKSYKTNAQRNKHLVVHSGVREFECATCGKAFAKKDHLNVHANTHDRVASFRCYVCSKSFRHGSARNRHMLIHTEH